MKEPAFFEVHPPLDFCNGTIRPERVRAVLRNVLVVGAKDEARFDVEVGRHADELQFDEHAADVRLTRQIAAQSKRAEPGTLDASRIVTWKAAACGMIVGEER